MMIMCRVLCAPVDPDPYPELDKKHHPENKSGFHKKDPVQLECSHLLRVDQYKNGQENTESYISYGSVKKSTEGPIFLFNYKRNDKIKMKKK